MIVATDTASPFDSLTESVLGQRGAAGSIAPELASLSGQTSLQTSHHQSPHIAFVDRAIADIETLIQGLSAASVVLIDTGENGIQQITQTLSQFEDLASVQIFAHGSEARLDLGAVQLSAATLNQYADELTQWGEAIAPDGDLLLYGCNVAAGQAGQRFIKQLSQLIAADVAASSDLTGHQGNWVLETAVGTIEADIALDTVAQTAFTGTLNLLTNGGFESDLTNWFGFSGQETTAGDAFSGSAALQLTNADAGTAQIISATANQTYTLAGYAKSSASGYNAIGLTFFDASYNTLSHTASNEINAADWQTYQVDVTAPTGTAFAQVWTYRSGSQGIVSIDALTLTTEDTPPAADTTRPTASINATEINSSGGSRYEFSVDYSDNVAIDVSTLGTSDVQVNGPNGFSQLATFVSVNNNTDGSARTAQYQITAPSGSWNDSDNGTYAITLQANEVTDTSNNSLLATTASFDVDIATGGDTTGGGTELLTNGSFESGLTDWFGFSGQEQRSTSQTFSGNSALELSTADSGIGNILSGTSGETYRLSGYAKSSSSSYSAFGLNFFDANYAVLARVESGNINTPNWQQYQMEEVAPAGTAFVQVWAYKGDSNGSTFIDELSLKAGTEDTPPTDSSPMITSNGGGTTATLSVAEGTALVTDVNATGNGLTYAIAGGTDANDFTIDSVTGALSFTTTPDYEAAADADSDNVYAVDVVVTDGAGLSDTQALLVTVTNEVSVFLLGGQSNMVGLGSNNELPVTLQTPYPSVQIWQEDIQAFSDLRPGFAGASGNWPEFGPELTFGRGIDGFATEEVYLIKHAEGATTLADDWNPSGANNTEYDTFTGRVANALAALNDQNIGYAIEGMLWMQGESDTGSGANAYESNLTAFIADMRDRYSADLKFVIGKLNPTFIGAVTEAQAAIAAADPLSYIVNTDSFELLSDDVHYSTTGQIDLGFAFADAFKNS